MLSRAGINVEEMTAEFDGASLGDARLDDRLRRIVAMASVAPSDSFPDQMESVADREALYRFLANPKVTMRSVLRGHVGQTLRGLELVRPFESFTTPLRFGFLESEPGSASSEVERRAFLDTSHSRWLRMRPANRLVSWAYTHSFTKMRWLIAV